MADRPAISELGIATPEMIEAGVAAMYKFDPLGYSDEERVTAIFSAMLSLRRRVSGRAVLRGQSRQRKVAQ